MKNTVIIIPTRLGAQRFPNKPLAKINNIPMIIHVLNRAKESKVGEVFVATPDDEIFHVVNQNGINYGPNLSKIGDKLSKRGLYLAILDPSSGISPTYIQNYIELEDGRDVIGYILSETNSTIDIKSAGGIINNIKKNEIISINELDHSIMPNNLQNQMSVDDFVDLVEYMASLK